MAKFNGGIFSKLKGKLAGVVFQQYEGMQVGKEYQPNVKNPSTAKQVESRAKFKAASQLVATFAEIFMISIAKLSSYDRTLRGALVRVLTRAASWDDNTETASIKDTDSAAAVNGLVFNPPIPAPIITGTDIGHATISATVGDTVKYKIVAFDADGLTLGVAETSFVATATSESIQAPLTSVTPTGYSIAAVATRLVNSTGNPLFGNLTSCSTLIVRRGVSDGDILASHVACAEIAQA